MTQNTVTNQVRASSLALALVLLSVLGLLAMRAEAQEPTNEGVGAPPVPTLFQENREERRALYEENKLEREGLADATPEERQEMLRDQRAEVEAWRTQTREEFRSALEARREQLQVRLEEHRVEREERREEMKARLSEEAQERLGGYAERMAERMSKIIEHLTSIADRIASRIEKIEEEHSVDLSEASNALEDAYDAIDTAKEDVAKLVALVDDALTSDDPKDYMDEVREAAGVAKESIRAVHRALSDAVVGVRAGTPEEKQENDESEEESAE